jgi:predicted transcriptional regulator
MDMGEVPLSLHVKAEVKQKLEEEARLLDISADSLAERAIQSYFEVCASERELLKQRVAEADKGVFISSEAMHRWMTSWGTDNELPPPEPDVFLTPRQK